MTTWIESIQKLNLTRDEYNKVMFGMNDLIDLSTDELWNEFWDVYKSYEGIRPRWCNPQDRDGMLFWFAFELTPAQTAYRKEEFERAEVYYAEMEAEENERYAAMVAETKEVVELINAYDVRYDHFDPSLKGIRFHRSMM